jgi:hypothetical protein
MSHVTRVKTTLSDREDLKAALEDLGHKVWFDVGDEAPAGEGDESEAMEVYDILSVAPNGECIAFQREGDRFYAVTDWYEFGMPEQEFLGLLTQRYSYRVTLRKLAEQGFLLASQESEGGTVRLVLARGGQEVEGHIGTAGEMSLTARGFQGSACLDATRPLEEALGGDIVEQSWTPEGFFGGMTFAAKEKELVPLIPLPKEGLEKREAWVE